VYQQRDETRITNLATTLRTARADSEQVNTRISRLESRNEELARQLAASQAQAKSATEALRKSERETRTLREETARAKQQTTQVRAACANDIRKRDVQIQRLKGHLNEQQRGTAGPSRGKKDAFGVMKIVIVPGSGPNSGKSSTTSGSDGSNMAGSDGSDLKSETSEFLTQLCQELSDENDHLIALVRGSLGTLKELQGLPESVALRAHGMRAGLEGLAEEGMAEDELQGRADGLVQAPPMSYAALSIDMEHVLDNLRNLLTNPNFVPIDEVHARDEEIQTLRIGFEKLECKWREAIFMMDGWRKRMSEGDAVNLDDIKRGLGLGRELGNGPIDANGRRGLLSASVMAMVEDSLTELESSGLLESLSEEEEDDIECSGDFEDTGHGMTTTGIGFTTTVGTRFTKPLVEGDGNAAPRRVNFKSTSQLEEVKYMTMRTEDENSQQRGRSGIDWESSRPSASQALSPAKLTSSNLVRHSVSPSPVLFVHEGRRTRKRSSSPTPLADERSQKLTVQEKLNVAEAEAAAVAAGLDLEDLDNLPGLDQLRRHGEDKVHDDMEAVVQEQDDAHVARATETRTSKVATQTGINKTRITGKARRRKSTLTPQELEDLMLNC
jgi:hypothetical protein